MFYSSEFHPKLIAGQMALLQSLHYLGLALLLLLAHEMVAAPPTTLTLRQLLSYRAVSEHAALSALVTVVNGALVGVAMYAVVERAKKCLDFASTVYLLHLAACWWWAGFPRSWEWWAVNGVALGVAAVLGETLCVRKEMRDIKTSEFLSLHGYGAQGPSALAAAGGAAAPLASTSVSGGGGASSAATASQLPGGSDGKAQGASAGADGASAAGASSPVVSGGVVLSSPEAKALSLRSTSAARAAAAAGDLV